MVCVPCDGPTDRTQSGKEGGFIDTEVKRGRQGESNFQGTEEEGNDRAWQALAGECQAGCWGRWRDKLEPVVVEHNRKTG